MWTLSDSRDMVKSDCRYFIGDRPCRFHKAEGVKCADCDRYSAPQCRILLIKLGAMGDVLRTTSILPALRQQHGYPHVTWLTAKESVGLLENNPLVNSLMVCGGESLARLQVETFDLVINPEAAKDSAALATMAKGKEKRGFGLSPKGFVFPFNQPAEEIFHMGLFDDVKRRNQKTYEELICQLSELSYLRVAPALCLTDEEMRYAEKFRAETGIRKSGPIVGINTGGGSRWPLKRWTMEGFVHLAKRLFSEMAGQIVLLGGPAEVEINREIMAQPGVDAVDTGCLNPPRKFAALINLCDVVVTGDTLALHIGLALHKRMVVLFGPTSTTEIDLYGLGTKIASELDCLCCYHQVCDQSPTCMESISVEAVYQAVTEQISLIDETTDESICNNSDI